MFDRSVDLVSPFYIMQTFEGFMDENVGIETCKVKVDNTILYPDPKVREELKVPENQATELELTSDTIIYDQVRDKHFDGVGPFIN